MKIIIHYGEPRDIMSFHKQSQIDEAYRAKQRHAIRGRKISRARILNKSEDLFERALNWSYYFKQQRDIKTLIKSIGKD
jgi:hypothetical protein